MRVAQLIFTGINKKDAEAVLTGTSQHQYKKFTINSLQKKPPYTIKRSFEWSHSAKIYFPMLSFDIHLSLFWVKISKS